MHFYLPGEAFRLVLNWALSPDFHQLKEYEKKLHHLNQLKKEKGKSAAIFKLKENIVGIKKTCQEAVTMKDPESGELIVENDKLKEASMKYVSNLLTNRCPKIDYQEEFNLMESLHDERYKEASADENLLTVEDYKTFIKQISKKNKDKYQFILKAGKSFHLVLFSLYEKVWNTEKRPSSWQKTTCIQLYNEKGRKDEFNSQRFIHTKDDSDK